MIWSSLFLVSIIQALFLVSLIVYRRAKNPVASWLIIALLIIIIFTNLGYLSIRTDLRHYMPQLFGIPLGMILLFGPLLYFYSRSIIDNSFSWKKKYWLHFLPYLFQLGINMPLLLMSSSNWNWFIK